MERNGTQHSLLLEEEGNSNPLRNVEQYGVSIINPTTQEIHRSRRPVAMVSGDAGWQGGLGRTALSGGPGGGTGYWTPLFNEILQVKLTRELGA